jgi:hypothetical protein
VKSDLTNVWMKKTNTTKWKKNIGPNNNRNKKQGPNSANEKHRPSSVTKKNTNIMQMKSLDLTMVWMKSMDTSIMKKKASNNKEMLETQQQDRKQKWGPSCCLSHFKVLRLCDAWGGCIWGGGGLKLWTCFFSNLTTHYIYLDLGRELLYYFYHFDSLLSNN